MNHYGILRPMVDIEARMRLVGEAVRAGMGRKGALGPSAAAREWRVSLPTLNRLLSSGNVGARFYRAVEKGLDWPVYFLDWIVDGDVERIKDADSVDASVRAMILRELRPSASTDTERPQRRARRA